MHNSLQGQYKECDCESCRSLNLSAGKPKHFQDAGKAALKAFKKLHETGSYKPKDLLKIKEYRDLINATSDIFTSAITHEVPEEMKQHLENDAFIFSGLKTHAQLTEARSLLKDGSGNIRPYEDFERSILKLNEQYNTHYLEAEYEFAVQSSQSVESCKIDHPNPAKVSS